MSREHHSGNLPSSDQQIVKERYEMITEVIPSNTDKEFIKAKKDFQEKEANSTGLITEPTELFDEKKLQTVIQSRIKDSREVMNILKTLSNTDARLFLGGGIIRNLVWDYLHGYKNSTPIEDVDVVYFDSLSNTKEHDKALEKNLEELVPNYKWSVKNQARMHIFNEENEYQSLEDAISKWPETATAIAVRLHDDGQIEIVAPYGFTDLFRLLVIPTPHFYKKLHKYKERLANKNWVKNWPKLRFVNIEE
ncbi:nucleotidyltransferase family protein [Chloroflexota bacterium]